MPHSYLCCLQYRARWRWEGVFKGRWGPSKSFALSILLSLLLSTQEVPGRDPSGKWGWKVLRFHVKLCVVSDPATRGSPGNNQAEKALLSHSTLVAKHTAVCAIRQPSLSHYIQLEHVTGKLPQQSYGATQQQTFDWGRHGEM